MSATSSQLAYHAPALVRLTLFAQHTMLSLLPLHGTPVSRGQAASALRKSCDGDLPEERLGDLQNARNLDRPGFHIEPQ
jgi:hypothetical protein